MGSKRYSIEGVAGVIPLLDSIFDEFAERGGEVVMIAMSHRGRLNVMTNVPNIEDAEWVLASLRDVMKGVDLLDRDSGEWRVLGTPDGAGNARVEFILQPGGGLLMRPQ